MYSFHLNNGFRLPENKHGGQGSKEPQKTPFQRVTFDIYLYTLTKEVCLFNIFKLAATESMSRYEYRKN